MKKEQFFVTGLTEMTASTSLQNPEQFSVLLVHLIMKIQQPLGKYCAICIDDFCLFMIVFCMFFIFFCPFIPQRKPLASFIPPGPYCFCHSLCFCFLGFHGTVPSWFFISNSSSQPLNVGNVLFHLFRFLYCPLI